MVEDRRRRWVPPPALCGFLLLLVLIFTASYAVGRAAGPVAPGMHDARPGSGSDTRPDGDNDSGGGGGMGGMHGGGH
ncbi:MULTISPECIES: hypothetical protein [Streptomyces]|uniref:Secreted protein n=1 Tax=Streptomyces venezuelae TaxID=54571 RepID=A0A5P2BL24_STRVZ|nr:MULTISPECIES: hypothetical protein [Streptomyces]NEA01895.1 hypothetical protein [Streptomyces sp. SID10116]MYY82018.1 hypothetical protein [Streptomyces sp. SID335]MYZ15455.1 hypothetical protein [Streptomyces sp. SID337]NDZ84854.1 hypothetical protein [Streptomyces sp. SID10115]NEB43675.1 hypothetical protein [Streptomyces sp. SID339]